MAWQGAHSRRGTFRASSAKFSLRPGLSPNALCPPIPGQNSTCSHLAVAPFARGSLLDAQAAFSTPLKVAARLAVLFVDLRRREHGSEPNASTPGGCIQAAPAPQVKHSSSSSSTWSQPTGTLPVGGRGRDRQRIVMASKHPSRNFGFCRIALRPQRDEISTCKPLAQSGLLQKLESDEPLATSESFTNRTG
jgi:hypothetical protein